jgi:hypothetical protein
MPLGNALPANAFRCLVADFATPTTFVPLGLMNTFNVGEQENVAEFDTFDSDDPIAFAGKPRRTLSLNGYLGDADSGQAIALAAARAKGKIILKFLWDGTNGFTQECRVNSYQSSGRAGNEPIALSFDFMATKAVGTVVASGPLL